MPLPIGFVGNDTEGRQLLAFFRKLGIDTKGIRVEPSWRTPTKTRILAGAAHSQRQQIVRKCALRNGLEGSERLENRPIVGAENVQPVIRRAIAKDEMA